MAGRRGLIWPLIFGVTTGALFVAERLRPLRVRQDPAPMRVPRNLTIGLLAAATTAACEMPIVAPVQQFAVRRRLGLLRLLPLPRALRIVLGFLLLDYTLYLWHWLNHRVPALWRFHAVHHVDLDLDSTTGIRFHFGELMLAAGFRAAQLLVLGVEDEALRLWQRCLLLDVVFQHSNVALSDRLEARLVTAIVTPRMHGIHHSMQPEEANTNFSSLLAWWDRLHGTLRLDVPQQRIRIGVCRFEDPTEMTLAPSLVLPFTEDQRLLPSARPLLHTSAWRGRSQSPS